MLFALIMEVSALYGIPANHLVNIVRIETQGRNIIRVRKSGITTGYTQLLLRYPINPWHLLHVSNARNNLTVLAEFLKRYPIDCSKERHRWNWGSKKWLRRVCKQ